jgi:hypothetical protein
VTETSVATAFSEEKPGAAWNGDRAKESKCNDQQDIRD